MLYANKINNSESPEINFIKYKVIKFHKSKENTLFVKPDKN
jgi:hypothetical protein